MIYLDHAATSWPKPQAVVDAVQRWFVDVGTSAERGDGKRTALAAAEVQAARAGIGALLGWPALRVAFCSGATEGLNLALRSLLAQGDVVLTTAFEHSSVVRPLRALQRERGLALHVLAPTADLGLDAQAFARRVAAVRPRLCVVTHASNVTGTVFDVAAFAQAAHDVGALCLLDASQTAGWLDLRTGCDVVVASTHKGLQSPPGLGFVAARPDLELAPAKQGGTGSSQALDEHPTRWPGAFEAGTPNTPALFGLAAALRRHATLGDAPLRHALACTERLADGLRAMPAIRLLHGPAGPRLPVLSFVHEHYDPLELGVLLDQHDIHVRSGHHCAPWIHEHLGTSRAGTVRLSPGPETTFAEIDTVLAALASL